MLVRNVVIRLKPLALSEFTRIFNAEIVPILRRQAGFLDAFTFSIAPTGTEVIAISLWSSEEAVEAYNASGYAEVLNSLSQVLDGTPRVRVANVISSTLYTTAHAAA
jgi:quinol monooxygenase YgiN